MDHPTDILEIEVDQDAVLMDMDTPEEYRKQRKLAGLDES
jgi:CTP:molybdopterin cytidylyltransferase MocA